MGWERDSQKQMSALCPKGFNHYQKNDKKYKFNIFIDCIAERSG